MAGGGAAAQAAIANAIRASGVLIRMESADFLTIMQRQEMPLVVIAEGGFWGKTYQYLTSYAGLAFFAKSKTPLDLPQDTEIISAKKIWIPT
ncbi:MAG: hypothetical protein JSV03_02105 [Planctomycetota bacterium]|nr:MAG: hypothetical protein JSV03_02105 [Planctomycetota bacterium]